MDYRLLNVPKELVSGDTYAWTEHISDYQNTEYSAKYIFLPFRTASGAMPITIISSPDPDNVNNFNFELSAVATGTLVVGLYRGSLLIFKGATERITACKDIELTVLPNPETATSVQKTTAEITLDNINAGIQKIAQSGVARVNVNGKEVEYHSVSELLKLKNTYERIVENERRSAGISKTKPTIICRFGNV